MQLVPSLQPDHVYHIYNLGNNGEDLFRAERDFRHFLELFSRHIVPVADVYAYCLMRNHFHVLLRVKSEVEWRAKLVSELQHADLAFNPTQHFSNLFNAYSKSFNAVHRRMGSLFQERFKRIEVASDRYLTNLVYYIHFNPQKHGFVNDFREWSWSSFQALTGAGPTKVQRDRVLAWFDGCERFRAFHCGAVNEGAIAALIEDDFV